MEPLNWDYAAKLPWGALLLFGGGLALSGQFGDSGLSSWLGTQMGGPGTFRCGCWCSSPLAAFWC